ncbi:Hpt domain-containing protein [Sphingomicrobium astaxanthinifaciens]|uniref:Hpt domain-containing protein n=1 Tax=Sphingomicrobium astaxanthinifaciens TaxID=1227949 RepID=UPI001FCC3362|nr:Hpt domain-containing protein [Sphingomicrobium astaxanthinifaciens]MCJ7421621.1 Hpt domain-containing protein [Sphingomicrobium astaxanthinifaciens]
MSEAAQIVDWKYFEDARAQLGPGFIKILGYFREDGLSSLEKIEAAMRNHDTVALIIPAHTMKGESRQFGAEPLAAVAETIENRARSCVEEGRFPAELVPDVVKLRQLFELTIEMFDEATNPRLRKPVGGFGVRGVHNSGFGRAQR